MNGAKPNTTPASHAAASSCTARRAKTNMAYAASAGLAMSNRLKVATVPKIGSRGNAKTLASVLLAFGVIIVVGFGLIAWAFDPLAVRRRARWGVAGVADPAGLPLIVLLLSTYLFVLTPALNTIVRTNEYEADVFGLNAARQPDGFTEAALLLGDYRKMAPGPIEEYIFYDHPSGRTRIFTAMRWKAAMQGGAPQPAGAGGSTWSR